MRGTSQIAALLLLAGCSPVSRIQFRCLAPKGLALERARLHVLSSARCPEGPVALPSPTARAQEEAGTYEVLLVSGDTAEITGSFRVRRCTVQVLVWYDQNGDGTFDGADLSAHTSPTQIEDRGIFGGNLTSAGEVVLSTVP
jgi:hypothetical protein